MRKKSKVPIVLVALLFMLAAAAEIGTRWSVMTADQTSEPTPRTAVLTLATF